MKQETKEWRNKMGKEVELFDKRFVHFMWDDALKGKEVIAANYISSLRKMVENGETERFAKGWDKAQKGIVSRSEDDEDFPFKVGGVENALAYYDPNYEAKRAYYKEGKEIVCYNPNLPLDEDEPCWLPCANPTWEDGLVYRLKEEECKEEECPCEDGVDSKACVGSPEDEKRKERHLPTWTRSWDKCAGCRHEEKTSDEEPCSRCFLDDMKYEPAEKKAEPTFQEELKNLLNRFGLDNDCDTPDHMLRDYLLDCLENYKNITKRNMFWHGWRGLT